MSLRLFSSNGEALQRNASAPNYNAAYSFLLAFRLTTLTANQALVQAYGTSGVNADRLWIFNSGGTGNLVYSEDIGGVDRFIEWNGAITAGNWYYAAIVRQSATSRELFAGTSPSGMISRATDVGGNVAARVAVDRIDYGSNDTAADFLNGRIRYGRIFTTALTLAQIKAASGGTLWGQYNFADATDYTDSSGNARDLSPVFITGTPFATEADDTVTWPEATTTFIPQGKPDLNVI